MTVVAFIGLGTMGAPMARNLLAAGFDVIGVNRSPGRVSEFVRAGGRAAAGLPDAVEAADVVVTMLPDTPDVEQVMTGPGGIFDHVTAGTLVIDFSTIRPDAAAALHRRAAELGLAMLDAPVSGGESGAQAGTLSIMAGGDETAFARARPVFDAIGQTIALVGGPGAGQTVKAANQLIVGGVIELVAEAIVFLRAHDVDLEPAVAVLRGGLAGNAILDRKAAAMLVGDFRPGFRVELHDKDMRIVTDAARQAGVVLPLGATVAELMRAVRLRGDGGLDHGAMLRLVEYLAGAGSVS